jgi:predicted SAM-dependent methyltransferase
VVLGNHMLDHFACREGSQTFVRDVALVLCEHILNHLACKSSVRKVGFLEKDGAVVLCNHMLDADNDSMCKD